MVVLAHGPLDEASGSVEELVELVAHEDGLLLFCAQLNHFPLSPLLLISLFLLVGHQVSGHHNSTSIPKTFHNQGSVKRGAFSTNAQSRFMSAVLDGDLCA